MARQWTERMAEISGFGGSYEQACRAMVLAAVEWLEAHPKARPSYSGIKGVFGIAFEENEDAREMTKAMMDARFTESDGSESRVGDIGVTGAMHHAAVLHVLWIKENGWDQYVEQMERLGAQAAEAGRAGEGEAAGAGEGAGEEAGTSGQGEEGGEEGGSAAS